MSTAALNRIANIAATAALQATSFFIGIWVAHKFSVVEFGTLQMLRLMIDYGLFLTVGVPAAVSFDLPLALGSGKGSESAIATGVLLWTCLFAAGVSMLALGSAEAFRLPLNGLYVPGQWIMSGLVLALTSLIIVPEIVLVSRESFRSLALARSCYTIVLTAGAILLVPSWGIVGFLVAMSGGAACEFLYWLLTSNGGLSFRWSLSHWKRYNSYGLTIQARKLLRVFLTSVDLWIVSALMGSRAAGIYAFSSLLIRGYQFLPGMLYETAFPRAAKEFAQDDGKLALTMGYLFKYLSAATPLFVASARGQPRHLLGGYRMLDAALCRSKTALCDSPARSLLQQLGSDVHCCAHDGTAASAGRPFGGCHVGCRCDFGSDGCRPGQEALDGGNHHKHVSCG